MKSKFRIDLPERGPDEPDATDRQIRFIGHLFDEIEAEDFSLDIKSLGKWQASSLINRLLEIQNGEDSNKISIKETTRSSGNFSKIILIIIFILILLWLLSLFGCTPHWCNSGKTLEEATKECQECDYDASIANFKEDLLRYYSFETCMKAKGYMFIDEEFLPPDFRKANVPRQSDVSFPLIRLGIVDSNFIRIAGK